MIVALIGQDIVGGEWLFGGYEAKVAAYVLVLAALRLVLLPERLAAATLLLAIATYMHVLVGGFWFMAAMTLRLLNAPRDLPRVVAATALFRALDSATGLRDRLVALCGHRRRARDRCAVTRRDLFDHP